MGTTTEAPRRRLASVDNEPAADGEPTPPADGEGQEPQGEGGNDEAAAPQERPPPPMQIALPGDWTLISGEFGGDVPTTSEIRLLGGKMPIDGSFAKGTELDLVVRVKVTGVLGQDTVDAWGETKGTIRRHMARLISVRRLKP